MSSNNDIKILRNRARVLKEQIEESGKSLKILIDELKSFKFPDIQKQIKKSKILEEYLNE